MRNRILIALIVMILTTTACLSGCGSFNEPGSRLERYSDVYFDAFDTVIELIAYSEDEESFKAMSEEIHKELLRYHYMFDIYKLYDGISNARTVNKKAGSEPVEVAPEFMELMKLSKELYDITGGRVNVAMGSVLSLWHEAREDSLENPDEAYIPDMEELKRAAQHCNMDDVIMDENAGTIFLKDPEMSLDMGAVAKGFAIEKVTLRLVEEGYDNFIISAGGNVRAVGKRGDGTNWTVAVQNPVLDSEESYIDKLELQNGSLVTSGVYRRFYEYQGESYHHIVDPSTLKPEHRYLSVSIQTVDSGRADALSTAVFNMDMEDGKEFIESLEGVEALWVLPDESIVKSSGWKSVE